MAHTIPRQSFGSSEARNAVLGSQFSGTTHFNFYDGTGERPAAMLLCCWILTHTITGQVQGLQAEKDGEYCVALIPSPQEIIRTLTPREQLVFAPLHLAKSTLVSTTSTQLIQTPATGYSKPPSSSSGGTLPIVMPTTAFSGSKASRVRASRRS